MTEDWFFASHFLPMARAAREMGAEVLVITRVREHRSAIEAIGARVIPLEAERRSLNPMAAGYAAGQLAAILRSEIPDIVHCIALRSILVGGTAAAMAGISRRVYALTGLGFFGAGDDLLRRGARLALRSAFTGPLQTARTHFLFENPDDPVLLGLDPGAENLTVVGGAGVDVDAFSPVPPPLLPPLRVAIVARMLWSKGIDLAVEATRIARSRGFPVSLDLYGAPDPSNPKAIPEQKLRDWDGQDGIAWRGRALDVARVWADHHVCCLPSRGGEGLPRTLLEGAACGRALVATNVPGCRALVRDGVEGLLVPADDPGALAEALARLASDPDLLTRMGEAARRRIFEGFTERDIMEAVKTIYARLLAT